VELKKGWELGDKGSGGRRFLFPSCNVENAEFTLVGDRKLIGKWQEEFKPMLHLIQKI